MVQKQVVAVENQVEHSYIRYSGYIPSFDIEFFENFNSEHTKAAYRRDLAQFFNFVNSEYGQLTHPQQLIKMHVIAFRNALTASNTKGRPLCCPKTVIRKLAAISSYCGFLMEKGLIAINPVDHIRRPKDEVITETNDLSDDQVKAVLEAVNINKKSGPLHKAILVLLFSTGMRKGELINLKIEDYREHQGLKIFQFIGKRGKISRVPLHPAAIFNLEKYIHYMFSKGHELESVSHVVRRMVFNLGLSVRFYQFIVKSVFI